jgi:hypothetical protein
MSLINNDRDMKKLLDDLSVGEFSAKDLQDIALLLPVWVLASALYAHAGDEGIERAQTPGQKSDVIARVLHAWCLHPDLRLGQLIVNVSDPPDCDPFYLEDGELARRLDKLADSALPPEEKPS